MALVLYDVHFEPPRTGLNALRGVRRNPGFLPVALWPFESNVQARLNQVRTLQRLRHFPAPLTQLLPNHNTTVTPETCW